MFYSSSIDCIWNGFTITEDRKDSYTWPNPYFNNKQIFVVRTDPNIDNIRDLTGKTVEVQLDSSVADYLTEDNRDTANKFKTLTKVDSYNTTIEDLKDGACDAIAMDIGIAEYEINNMENPKDFKILDYVITSEKYGIAFKKGNDDLKNKVENTLDEMFKDGTVEKIAQKYGFSSDTLIKPK